MKSKLPKRTQIIWLKFKYIIEEVKPLWYDFLWQVLTVEAFPGRIDDRQVVAGTSSNHQVKRTPLQQLKETTAPPSVRPRERRLLH